MIRELMIASLALAGCKSDHRSAPQPAPARPAPAPQATRDVPPPAPVKPEASATAGWSSITELAHGEVHATSLAIDSKGNVVVAIELKGHVAIGATTFEGGEGGVALAQVKPDGTVAWSKQLAKDTLVEDAYVAIDSKDAIVIAATLRGSVDLGGGALASAGDKDILVAKLASDGTLVWAHRYGGSEPDRPAAVAVDGKDQIVVAGYYAGTVDFGGKKLASKNDAEMFVARYAPDGKLVVVNRISGGGTTTSELFDVAVDAKNNAIAIGGFGEKLDLGGASLAGKADAAQTYVVAFTPGGQVAWSKAYGTGPITLMNAVAADGTGAVILGGAAMSMPADQNNMVSFDVKTGAPSQGSMTMFVAGLGADHQPKWSLPIAAAGMGDQVEIAIADKNELVLVGDAQSAPFGDKSLTGVHAYAARVSAAGKLLWARAIPNATSITTYAKVATRGTTVVVAARTGEKPNEALAIMRPE